jgi:hypothetical protein
MRLLMLAFEGGGTRAGTGPSHGCPGIGRVMRPLSGPGGRGPCFGVQKDQLAACDDECLALKPIARNSEASRR